MKIIEKYTGKKTYMAPNGELMTPEIIQQKFPAVLAFNHIVETNETGEVCFAVQNLSAMREIYNVNSSLSEDEAIAKIQEIVNTPTPDPGPTTEERTAAALEFLAMSSMPDVE